MPLAGQALLAEIESALLYTFVIFASPTANELRFVLPLLFGRFETAFRSFDGVAPPSRHHAIN